MTLPSLTVICDFDGTITTRDVGHALCSRFAPGTLDRLDALWLAGEISFDEAFRQACLDLRAPASEMVAHALEVGVLREGFAELLESCASLGVELVVASAGLDLYVEPIFDRDLGAHRSHIEMHVNKGRFTPEGVVVTFPHESDGCKECRSCKGARARKARREGRTVIAVGDSVSDRCLVREADHVFARSWLLDHCAKSGIASSPFEDFSPVTRLVRALTATH